jgi:hypothetical protein
MSKNHIGRIRTGKMGTTFAVVQAWVPVRRWVRVVAPFSFDEGALVFPAASIGWKF